MGYTMDVNYVDKEPVKINIGCGGRPLEGYINIDMDSLEKLKKRYPNRLFQEDLKIFKWDIFNVPVEDDSVDEVLCEALIEHLSFQEEPRFFFEVKRVLKPGRIFIFSTIDFEEIVKLWAKAEDDWKDFFRNDEQSIAERHWFGTYTYKMENRWGYIIASIFGSQNGDGQYHKNCYTIKKLQAIMKKLSLEVLSYETFLWKGERDPMIRFRVRKPLKAPWK